MLDTAKEYVTDLYRLFYPKLCGGCDIPLAKGEEHLCLHCRLELPFTNFETLKNNPVENIFRGRATLNFATSLLYFSSGEKTQHILHNIKYNNKRELAIYIGKVFGERLQNNPYLSSVTMLMPVPLHPQKEHLRGYNQSALIAEGINEMLQKKFSVNNLQRNIYTETQTKKTRVERWENVEKAFKLIRPKEILHQHILLIDDVLTTGATLEACANVLHSEGCTVSIATVAFAVN
jgi:ComF family protein